MRSNQLSYASVLNRMYYITYSGNVNPFNKKFFCYSENAVKTPFGAGFSAPKIFSKKFEKVLDFFEDMSIMIHVAEIQRRNKSE